MELDPTKWIQKQKNVVEGYREDKNEKERDRYKRNRKKIIKKKQEQYFRLRKELYKELGDECRFCGSKNDLHFHHTVPMYVFENKIYHYKRNKDILCLLCERCHIQWHIVMDQLLIDDIFKDSGDDDKKNFYKTLEKEFGS